ncbi:MAG: EamA family transporter [Deltaproteobacteria bacterium]|nr:EamA family transporter [Deltaproteobacteria bacterium]
MKNWYWFSLATMICWGSWGIFGKLASTQINSRLLVLVSITTSFLLLWIIFLVSGFEIEKNGWGIGYAVLAGIAGSIGSIFFYLALKQGKASVVVPLTALYPLVAVALSVLFLKEEISGVNVIGIILALAASLLLSL